MNSSSEQMPPMIRGMSASRGNALGWFLSIAMALVWCAFWGFWLRSGEEPSRGGGSGAPVVSFLPESGVSNRTLDAETRAILSPAIFSLPSEAGFSRGALTNSIGARPSLQTMGSVAFFLALPRASASESDFPFVPALEKSVREALTNLPDQVPEPYVFANLSTTGANVQVELSSGLEQQHIRTMDVPSEDVLLKDKPWDASAFVEFNEEGKVSGVFLETKSSFEDVDASLIRSLWGWQIEKATQSVNGRVTFSSSGRPQLAEKPQTTGEP